MTSILQSALQFLIEQNVILYPTDTVWGIGCDATSKEAVKKIYQLKNRQESKALIVLVSSTSMLKKHVAVSKKVLEVLDCVSKPTTVIFQNPKGLAKNLVHKEDNSVAIRIVQDTFCKRLIEQFGKPIVSTSANISGKPTPKSFSDIDAAILKGVDYVVNLRTDEIATKSSTIIQINGDKVVVIRD